MNVPYLQLHAALLHADPVGGIRAFQPADLPTALADRILRLRALAKRTTDVMSLGSLGALPKRLHELEQIGTLTAFPDSPSMAGRHPLVVAHGPSLKPLLAQIRSERDRLFVIAPFRTALPLAEAGVIADVVVLAYPLSSAAIECEDAWRAAPVEIRNRVAAHSTVLIDPFAPAAIFQEFDSIRIFDDGAGLLPEEAQLPFWGYALVPGLAYALRLGAPAVAIAGVDLTAPTGLKRTDWSGRSVRLPRRLEVLYRLLGLLASTDARLVDLSAQAIRKPGFTHELMREFLSRAAAPAQPARPPLYVTAASIAERVIGDAGELTRVVRQMAAVAERAVRLAESDEPIDRPVLADLVERMERDWRAEPPYRTVVQLLQPEYLCALWQLRALVKPRNVDTANRHKARLLGREFLDLVGTFDRWLDSVYLRRSVPPTAAVV